MASIKKRNNGNLSLVFRWQGKQWIKALGTTDEKEAEQIKKDAGAQLDRIRQGESPLAARLLADGISITDVLFGSRPWPLETIRIERSRSEWCPLSRVSGHSPSVAFHLSPFAG
jgi:hypothetical protein